jgi:hypothetical protein
MKIKFDKKNIKNKMSINEIEKQINLIRNN